jgi:hypothetical protein
VFGVGLALGAGVSRFDEGTQAAIRAATAAREAARKCRRESSGVEVEVGSDVTGG